MVDSSRFKTAFATQTLSPAEQTPTHPVCALMARARQHTGLLGVETATLANASAGQAYFTGDAAPKRIFIESLTKLSEAILASSQSP